MAVRLEEADFVCMRSTILFVLVFTAVSAHATDVPLVLSREHSVPLIDVKVNGKVARFILDTGSSNTLVSADLTAGSVREQSEFRSDRNGMEVRALVGGRL